jgi:NAD(P)-dependent dehydrogenase (short-subunit alcohol dehydrogenase family)
MGVRTKIRVNALSPGIFPSEMTTMAGDEAQSLYPVLDKASRRNPVGKLIGHC